MKKIYWILLFSLVIVQDLSSQSYIKNIYIDRRDVFDTSKKKDKFFADRFLNSLHSLTKKYIIEDELLFQPEDLINEDVIQETERNLRATGLFTDVKIEFDSASIDSYNLFVTTQDRWSTEPSALFGSGGNSMNYGARFVEYNLAGTGTQLLLEALNRSESDIGWQGIAKLSQRRLFRTEISLNARILAHKYRTEDSISLYKPFRTFSTNNSFGITFINNYGKDFLFNGTNQKEFMPLTQRKLQAWYSEAWHRKDRVFITGFLELDNVERAKKEYKQVFDNSGKVLIAFSSVSQNYIETKKLNYYATEDFPIGGWGSAVLGRIFPIGSKGDNYYYVAGQGEKSYLWDNLYLFGQVTGAGCFTSEYSQNVYQEFLGLGFYRLSNDLLIAARIRQQNVWNWNGLRQLILDNDAGLRGYSVNKIQGDNRIVANLEFRAFPEIELWIFKLSGALFWDTGSAWRQQTELSKTKWHNSVGLGIRFENTKFTGPGSVFRIDFAFNCDERKFGEIIFTSDQLFSIFKHHIFRLPELYGTEFDKE